MTPEQHTEILRKIDEELERPPVTIEDALAEAVYRKRMSQEEAAECYDAYLRAFNGVDIEE